MIRILCQFLLLALPVLAHAAPSVATWAGWEARRVLDQRDLEPSSTASAEELAVLRENRVASIEQSKRFIALQNPQGEERAYAMLVLAGLYLEEARDLRRSDELATIERLRQCLAIAPCNPEAVQPAVGDAERWSSRAITLYETILRVFPGTGYADEVRWRLARELRELGRADEAANILTELVRGSAQPPWSGRGWLMLGELEVERGHLQSARRAFEAASREPPSEWSSYTLYRLAWTQVELGDRELAISTLRQAQDLAGAEPQAPWAKLLARREQEDLEGLRRDLDLVAPRLLRAARAALKAASKDDSAVGEATLDAYRVTVTFLSLYGTNPEAKALQADLATMLERVGRIDLTVDLESPR